MSDASVSLSVLPSTYGKHTIVILCLWLFFLVTASASWGDEEGSKLQGVEYLFPRGDESADSPKNTEKQARRQATLLKRLKNIEAGGLVDASDKHGQTTLMYAAAVDNRLAVCWLVARGAKVTLKSENGTTASALAHDLAIKGLLSACISERKSISESEESERSRYGTFSAESLDGLSDYACLVKYVRFGASFAAMDPNNTAFLTAKFPTEGLAFLIRHGFPAKQCDINLCKDATPEQLRLLLALGMSRQTDDADKELRLDLLLDDMPSIRSTLQQHPEMAKNADFYGLAQSEEAVKALVAAAENPPDSQDMARVIGAGRVGVPAMQAFLNLDSSLLSNEDFIGKLIDRDCAALIDVLLKAGLAPDFSFKNGESMLHRAAGQSSPNVVRALLKAGVDPNSRDGAEHTPLMQAGKLPTDVAEMQELIRGGADVNAQDRPGNTPLIFLLTRRGDLRERIQVLLDANADVEKCTNLGTTPLMMACHNSDPEERLACSRLLLEHGAKINAQDASGRTAAIRLLQEYDDSPTLKLLLDAGADVSLQSKEGKSLLFTARELDRVECLDLLSSRGVQDDDFTKPDKEGRTLLMRAALNKDGLGTLQTIIRKGWGRVDERDKEGRTALHLLIAEDGDIRLRMLELFDAKANVNLAANDGTTPLMVACRYKIPIKRIFRIRQLLAANANPNVQDAFGCTAAMHLVSTFDDAGSLKVLLDAHAATDVKNKEGETLLSLARIHKRSACIKLLEARSAKEPNSSSTLGSTALIILAAVLLALLLFFIIRRRK